MAWFTRPTNPIVQNNNNELIVMPHTVTYYNDVHVVTKLKGKANPQNKKKACSEMCKFLISTPETTPLKKQLNFD